MKRTWWSPKANVLVVVLAMVAGLSGRATEVRAFEFSAGDLVLAVFGNSQEYYRDLGSASALLSSGALNTFNINSPLNPLSGGAGPEPIQWTLLSGQGTTQTNIFINIASQLNSADTIASQSNNLVLPVNTNITSWRNTIAFPATTAGSEILLNASDPASFTTKFGIGGTLGGSFTGGGLQGSLGNLLTMIMGQARVGTATNVLTDVGYATLLADGTLSICGGAGCSVAPVPVPAAMVLFGSGLIGLVGIARRKVSQLSA